MQTYIKFFVFYFLLYISIYLHIFLLHLQIATVSTFASNDLRLGLIFLIAVFQGWKCLKTYKDLTNIINVLLHDREERDFGSAIK